MVKLDDVKSSLDGGRNTAALQQVNTLLKKEKQNVEAKALKGLALVRLNRDDEANAVIEELRKIKVSGDAAQAVLMCYREYGAYKDICRVHEQLYDEKPDDSETAAQYFMSMVRIGQLDNLPKVAMSMYKRTKSSTYYFWAVMVQFIQARKKSAAGDETGMQLNMAMARRMMERVFDDDTFKMSREGLRLYIMILEAVGAQQEILNVLDRDAAGSYSAKPLLPEGREVTEIKIRCYQRLHRFDDIATFCTPKIEQAHDDWTCYANLMDAAVAVNSDAGSSSSSSSSPSSPSSSPSSSLTYERVDTLLKNAFETALHQSKPQRAPFLACLEWRKRMLTDNHSPSVPDALRALFELFKHFGSKRCMFFDAKEHITLLDSAGQQELLDACNDWMASDGTQETEAKQVLRSTVLGLLQRYMGRHHADGTDRTAVFEGLMSKFKASKKTGLELKPSELQYGDSYAILAADVAFDAFSETGDRSCLDRAIALLEDAIGDSGSNPQLRLLIIKLLCIQGRAHDAIQHWTALDVKQIQYDSIGYVFFDHVVRQGAYDQGHKLLEGASAFFRSSEVDVPEFFCRSFLYGSFHKYDEFTRCHRKLADSLQRAHVSCDRFLLNFIRTKFTRARLASVLRYLTSTLPAFESVQKDGAGVCNNCQAEVMDSSDPPPKMPAANDYEVMNSVRVNFFRFRCMLVHTLAALVLEPAQLSTRLDALSSAIDKVEEDVKMLEGKARTCFSFGINFPRTVFATPQQLALYRAFAAAARQLNQLHPVVASGKRGDEMRSAAGAVREPFVSALKAANDACAKAVKDPQNVDLELLHTIVEVVSLVSFTASFAREEVTSERVLRDAAGNPVRMNKTVRQTLRALTEAFDGINSTKGKIMSQFQKQVAAAETATTVNSYQFSLKAFRAAFKSSGH